MPLIDMRGAEAAGAFYFDVPRGAEYFPFGGDVPRQLTR